MDNETTTTTTVVPETTTTTTVAPETTTTTTVDPQIKTTQAPKSEADHTASEQLDLAGEDLEKADRHLTEATNLDVEAENSPTLNDVTQPATDRLDAARADGVANSAIDHPATGDETSEEEAV